MQREPSFDRTVNTSNSNSHCHHQNQQHHQSASSCVRKNISSHHLNSELISQSYYFDNITIERANDILKSLKKVEFRDFLLL